MPAVLTDVVLAVPLPVHAYVYGLVPLLAVPVNVELLPSHTVSVPLMLTAGLVLFVNATLSVDAVHDPLEIVHVKVALLPAVTPVTPDVAEEAVVMVAVPLDTVHKPLPTEAALPAKVKAALAHCSMSLPAADTVGVLYTVPLAATFLVVASVDVQATLPDGVEVLPLATELEDANLTDIVVLAIVPLAGVKVCDAPYVPDGLFTS